MPMCHHVITNYVFMTLLTCHVIIIVIIVVPLWNQKVWKQEAGNNSFSGQIKFQICTLNFHFKPPLALAFQPKYDSNQVFARGWLQQHSYAFDCKVRINLDTGCHVSRRYWWFVCFKHSLKENLFSQKQQLWYICTTIIKVHDNFH